MEGSIVYRGERTCKNDLNVKLAQWKINFIGNITEITQKDEQSSLKQNSISVPTKKTSKT